MSDFPGELLSALVCPCCGSGFEVSLKLAGSSNGVSDGVLRCDCYEYPVVDGIPVLRQLSPVASTQNGAVARLREGDVEGALIWLLAAGTAPGVPGPASPSRNPRSATSLRLRLCEFVRRRPGPSAAARIPQMQGFETVLHATRPRAYANYLFHRFANPSFLGALPPLIVLGDALRRGPRRRLLDLMNGAGHASATIVALCPELQVIMADIDFINLYIARRFLAPDTAALCLDVELPLPLCDGSIDGVHCLDGLHYVRSKVALLREVDRVVGPEGAWLFAHMHNASATNVNPGAPLDPRGYSQRFAFGQQRLLAETEILRQFQHDGSLDLTHQPPAAGLDSSNALTLVGARTEDLWRRHTDLDAALARRPDLLELNPLYRLEKGRDELIATAAWPSESLRRECMGTPPLLPESVRISSRTQQEIIAARTGGPLPAVVRELLRSFVLVPVPGCYVGGANGHRRVASHAGI